MTEDLEKRCVELYERLWQAEAERDEAREWYKFHDAQAQRFMFECAEEREQRVRLANELALIQGKKCETPDDVCPDYDGEHPYHESLFVKYRALDQSKMRDHIGNMELRLEELRAEAAQLIHERDRARMMAESSASLAEYRMRRIFDLEAELLRIKGERS